MCGVLVDEQGAEPLLGIEQGRWRWRRGVQHHRVARQRGREAVGRLRLVHNHNVCQRGRPAAGPRVEPAPLVLGNARQSAARWSRRPGGSEWRSGQCGWSRTGSADRSPGPTSMTAAIAMRTMARARRAGRRAGIAVHYHPGRKVPRAMGFSAALGTYDRFSLDEMTTRAGDGNGQPTCTTRAVTAPGACVWERLLCPSSPRTRNCFPPSGLRPPITLRACTAVIRAAAAA